MPGEFLHGDPLGRGQVEPDAFPVEVELLGPGQVGGQFQDRRQVRQLGDPLVPQRLQPARPCGQLGPIDQHVARHGGQFGPTGPAGAQPPVLVEQVPPHHADAPAVQQDGVRQQGQQVPVLGDPGEHEQVGRTPERVEQGAARRAQPGVDALHRIGTARPGQGLAQQHRPPRRQDPAGVAARPRGEHGAQRVVPLGEPAQGGVQRGLVQRSAQLRAEQHVQ